MPKLIWNENYWRDRAAEARAMGSDQRNDDCQRIIHGIADCYEHLATLSAGCSMRQPEGLSSSLRSRVAKRGRHTRGAYAPVPEMADRLRV